MIFLFVNDILPLPPKKANNKKENLSKQGTMNICKTVRITVIHPLNVLNLHGLKSIPIFSKGSGIYSLGHS